MSRLRIIRALAVVMIAAPGVTSAPAASGDTTASVLWQPSMNTFRRFATDARTMYAFYSDVLGFEPLTTFAVGGNTQVMRIKAGASQLKLTQRVPDRSYVDGGVTNATGLRLWTFFFSDEHALIERFERHGLPKPEFDLVAQDGRKSAIVTDPDGQLVELVITGDPPGTTYDEIEIGLVVSDIERSLDFYRDFVGLEELPPVFDRRFDTQKYVFRHEATFVTLRSFGDGLPADTGSGGIQYVVSNVDHVAALAQERGVTIDQPLSGLPGFSLRTIWLEDPDGITNYFAETAQARADGR
jgi:catechol 2,3-dioxygenase-like lactoylglutathione lyase family enzyme